MRLLVICSPCHISGKVNRIVNEVVGKGINSAFFMNCDEFLSENNVNANLILLASDNEEATARVATKATAAVGSENVLCIGPQTEMFQAIEWLETRTAQLV
jgi:hypothetical protein